MIDPADPTNQVAQLTGAASNEGYIVDLDGLAIADGTVGTVFFRMRSTGSVHLYLADGNLAGDWWTEDEAGVYTNVNLGDGSAFRPHWDIGSIEDVNLDEWYNFWSLSITMPIRTTCTCRRGLTVPSAMPPP